MKTTPSIFEALEPVCKIASGKGVLSVLGHFLRLTFGRLASGLAGLLFLVLSLAVGAEEGYAQRRAAFQTELQTNPDNQEVLYKLGELCHDEGINDNREAVKLAEKYFLQLLALSPQNARARVMYGSTLTMKGRDAFWPTTQLAHVNRGLEEMDAAVNLAPDDARVRLARALNNVHMPKFLGRGEVVRADYAWLWEKVLSQPASFSVEEKQKVALHQGRFLWEQKKRADAKQVWQRGIAQAPDSSLAREIQVRLRKTEAQ